MKTYYTEYPTMEFKAASDKEALNRGKRAEVIYRENDTKNGKPFIIIKNIKS